MPVVENIVTLQYQQILHFQSGWKHYKGKELSFSEMDRWDWTDYIKSLFALRSHRQNTGTVEGWYFYAPFSQSKEGVDIM